MKRIIIAGSRQFDNYMHLCRSCENLFSPDGKVEIVSGGARGADKLGELYAFANGYPLKRFLPNWAKYGRRAGPVRNQTMAEYADQAIIFWDGKSRGTLNLIQTLDKLEKPYQIFSI